MKPTTIFPCLWYDDNAKEAAEFYCSVFPDAKIKSGNPLVTTFELSGQKFMALNGGPIYQPNPSISFYVNCPNREEVQKAWDAFLEGGKVLMALDQYPWSEFYGWVQDRYGVSWQLAYGRPEDTGQKFSPLLMFTGQNAGRAEEAIQTYTSIFKPSSIAGVARYGAGQGDVEGYVVHAQFKLSDYVMMVMDSSLPHDFNFTEGISLVVPCETQAEIDYYWDRLTEGGEESMCGWLKDRYGVSWQIVPQVLERMMGDPVRSQAVIQAFLKMKKFDLAALERSWEEQG